MDNPRGNPRFKRRHLSLQFSSAVGRGEHPRVLPDGRDRPPESRQEDVLPARQAAGGTTQPTGPSCVECLSRAVIG